MIRSLPTAALLLLACGRAELRTTADGSDEPRPDDTAGPDTDDTDPADTDDTDPADTASTGDTGLPGPAYPERRPPYVVSYYGGLCVLDLQGQVTCYPFDPSPPGPAPESHLLIHQYPPPDGYRSLHIASTGYFGLVRLDGVAESYRNHPEAPPEDTTRVLHHGVRLDPDSEYVQAVNLLGDFCGLRPTGFLDCGPDGLYGSPVYGGPFRQIHARLEPHLLCAITVEGRLQCFYLSEPQHREDSDMSLHIPPVQSPLQDLGIGFADTRYGCVVDVHGYVFCDTTPVPVGPAGELRPGLVGPPPDTLQGHAHEVSVGARTACATGEGHRAVCWGWPGVASEPVIENVPDIPLRALEVAREIACGTSRLDDSIHCWGNEALVSATPFGPP